MERISIKPLVECQWGQGSPYYNNLKYNKKYQYVGCTALAIAQIMYYWMVQRGYHRGCKATSKYTTATNKYAVEGLPPITVFDWQHLVPKPKTTEEKKAVATLCEYIAKALHSDFGRSITSAKRTLAESVINGYLRLGESKHYYQSTVGKAAFDDMIYNDLANGRPVFMTGESSKDGNHAYVIDGYDAESNKYHVNWGWSGYLDGYYALSGMKPGDSNYNGSKMGVFNIQPLYKLGDANGDGVIDVSDVVKVINQVNKGTATKQTDINSDGKVTQEDVDLVVKQIMEGNTL